MFRTCFGCVSKVLVALPTLVAPPPTHTPIIIILPVGSLYHTPGIVCGPMCVICVHHP